MTLALNTKPQAHYSVHINDVSYTGTSCQLLVKEWTLNTGKLPPGGLSRNSVVK